MFVLRMEGAELQAVPLKSTWSILSREANKCFDIIFNLQYVRDHRVQCTVILFRFKGNRQSKLREIFMFLRLSYVFLYSFFLGVGERLLVTFRVSNTAQYVLQSLPTIPYTLYA